MQSLPSVSGSGPFLPPPKPVRASDADRTATAQVLQDAVARGLLTFDEGSDRMAAAYAARFVSDLPPLTEDLPPAAPPADPGWRTVWDLAVRQLRAELALVAAEGLRSDRSRRALVPLLVAMVLLLVLLNGLFGGGGHDFGGR